MFTKLPGNEYSPLEQKIAIAKIGSDGPQTAISIQIVWGEGDADRNLGFKYLAAPSLAIKSQSSQLKSMF